MLAIILFWSGKSSANFCQQKEHIVFTEECIFENFGSFVDNRQTLGSVKETAMIQLM